MTSPGRSRLHGHGSTAAAWRPRLDNHAWTATPPRPRLDGYAWAATPPRPLLDGHCLTATARRPQLDCHGSTATSWRPWLGEYELTVLAQQPRIKCRGSTASARQPRLGGHVLAAPLLRLHHRSKDRRLHHDGFASESRYDCATMVVPRQPCCYHCGTRAVLTPLHHHAFAMMAWPRLGHDGFALTT
jgi:hypothetical protein